MDLPRSRARVLYTRRATGTDYAFIRPGLDDGIVPQRPGDEVQTVLEFFQEGFWTLTVRDVASSPLRLAIPITAGMIAEAKSRGIPVVFIFAQLCSTPAMPRFFANVDYCLVASDFARRHYRDKVGLDCQALSYPVDWDRVRAPDRDPRFVTFVNPCVEKGVYPFARIAHELGRRRPDIPLLVVESRGTKENLGACGLDLAAAGNLQVMTHTTDPRRFWSLTKIALLPSLWWENQPLVAIEAMINGIPVVGSDRGGIPETVAGGGLILPLPERLTPATRVVPAAEEVEPWVEAIIRLWDDRKFYEGLSARALHEAQRWNPDLLRPLYAEFFRKVRHQPGAPVIASANAPALGDKSAPGLSGVAECRSNIDTLPISFVACVSDDAILKANLLASPCIARPGSVHEVILIHGAPEPPPLGS